MVRKNSEVNPLVKQLIEQNKIKSACVLQVNFLINCRLISVDKTILI